MPNPERELIESVRRIGRRFPSASVVRGIGDDCAVLKISPGHQLLVTTDLCVENVHFRRSWHPPASVGHRCLARGLSDIAAMGGKPLACFLSLGLPAKLPQWWADGFLAGFQRLAGRFGVELAGGDISAAREIVADIVVTGEAPAGTAVMRSGARPGDRIYVTGELGGSGATLRKLYAGSRVHPSATNRRHFFPEPRLEAGQWLRSHGLATAMIDVSDGLSVDLAHICEESKVNAQILADAVPVAKGSELQLAFDSGDDYELLFTAPPRAKVPARIAGIPVSEIGVIERADRKPNVRVRDSKGKLRRLRPHGWEHFGGNSDSRRVPR